MIDAIRDHFESLETTGEESSRDRTALFNQLNALPVENGERIKDEESQSKTESVGGHSYPDLSVLCQDLNEKASHPQVSIANSPSANSHVCQDTNPPASANPQTSNSTSPSPITNSAIRVDVNLLDKLMNLVGELVLCRNQILEFANQQAVNAEHDDAFKSASGRLNLVTSELQEGVMKTRMQPIRTIWSKFPRVVRDLAVSLNKQVQLEMEGEETELDKTLIEAIANPLTHLVRNCLDHGLDTPDMRIAAGKSQVGRLLLRAYHESGHVNIEVSDDGKGIDLENLKQKALQQGIITPTQALHMTEQEALHLIFLPSFSTSETVTNISGRGVGMDVVRANIERISGTIDVESRLGQGTSFKLKIPLTLAIIPTLIITSGGDRYAIPQVNLLELVRLDREQAEQRIEWFHGTPVYRLRGNLLPLVYLNQVLQLENNTGVQESSGIGKTSNAKKQSLIPEQEDETINIVVVQATEKPFGLVVDVINDTQEIVVKPLGKPLKSLACFAGATIMGDGKVVLILDVQGLAQKTLITSPEKEKALVNEDSQSVNSTAIPQQLLVFHAANQRRLAIPLSKVSRLEEFPRDRIEYLGDQEVIQYRQHIMPLIHLSAVLSNGYSEFQVRDRQSEISEDKQPVIVVSLQGDKQVGLVVDQVLDIVEQGINIKGVSPQKAILCSAVIQGKVTEIIDVHALIEQGLSVVKPMLV
ncbi:CheW-like domain protein [Coleofasciculus chthonoplastes PCC 7420]|uniref:histidine kinase n=1 Tax=Coleofasciculus chthonoplastes PCC 7420 TaxID=118168 RepID=B4VNU2_9CYAN|nr:chemotaxis protein CheW [Coleofasciculus chthonoplastes]EDX76359.1 CheW-like domain protein [Coleofasciculus chthonoplastes PCC 7420]